MFDFNLIIKSLPMLLQASVWTVIYSLSSVAIGFCIGTLMCAAGLSASRLGRGVAAFYVSFFRGVPLLVQLLISYYCLPLIGVNVPSSVAAVGTLALCTGAYIAEILRGGFLGIPHGLVEAARMVGLSRAQILTRIEVPLAVRFTLPSLVNETTMMVKASSLISVVGVLELTRLAQNIATSTFQPLEIYLTAGAIYFVINGVITLAGRFAESRFRLETAR
ncbi:amino acid ABC transporter [Ancylobacter defluvii]|uniref:Amino acid ABC transporter n=1 Tax=Ancylobacter defluvii TaxID=1282440 RepID=A0A9W6JU97_9HYPH|nr:amino acid ABC transporter permease [Ancylobacter defluvii]MBS7588586.1 amino acid ABC transporter permease [Ancylobacter defluvii]GLK83866.1 amino acid ABC transporter [Ancylobacter defluvii]